jgi:hypothetical protein
MGANTCKRTHAHTYAYCSIVTLSTSESLLGVIPPNCSRAKTFQAVDQMVLGQGAVAHGLRSRCQQVVSVAKGLVVLVELVQVRVLNLKENCMIVAVPDEPMRVQNRPLQNSSIHHRKQTSSVYVFLPCLHSEALALRLKFKPALPAWKQRVSLRAESAILCMRRSSTSNEYVFLTLASRGGSANAIRLHQCRRGRCHLKISACKPPLVDKRGHSGRSLP